jgi:hypothetical protein
MTDSPPLACSLSAAAAAERARRWRALLDRALLDGPPIAGGRRLVLRAEPGAAAELDDLVAAERECCPFLTMTIAPEGERLVLDVVAPPDAAPIVDAIFAEYDAREP